MEANQEEAGEEESGTRTRGAAEAAGPGTSKGGRGGLQVQQEEESKQTNRWVTNGRRWMTGKTECFITTKHPAKANGSGRR